MRRDHYPSFHYRRTVPAESVFTPARAFLIPADPTPGAPFVGRLFPLSFLLANQFSNCPIGRLSKWAWSFHSAFRPHVRRLSSWPPHHGGCEVRPGFIVSQFPLRLAYE